ncbi:MAG: hypothetical protein IKL80_05010 [Clostridia bacterium]|nr:hypothetical protein [Clostridia bacterium]
MTTINCSKDCLFQAEGVCCYDNILLSATDSSTVYDAECPYRRQKENIQAEEMPEKNYL